MRDGHLPIPFFALSLVTFVTDSVTFFVGQVCFFLVISRFILYYVNQFS